jgi:hypothetical protein
MSTPATNLSFQLLVRLIQFLPVLRWPNAWPNRCRSNSFAPLTTSHIVRGNEASKPCPAKHGQRKSPSLPSNARSTVRPSQQLGDQGRPAEWAARGAGHAVRGTAWLSDLFKAAATSLDRTVVSAHRGVEAARATQRLKTPLAFWQVQAHRTLVADPDPADLVRVARVQALITSTTSVLTERPPLSASSTATLSSDWRPRWRPTRFVRWRRNQRYLPFREGCHWKMARECTNAITPTAGARAITRRRPACPGSRRRRENASASACGSEDRHIAPPSGRGRQCGSYPDAWRHRRAARQERPFV